MVNVAPPPQLVVQPYQPQRMRRFMVLIGALWLVSLLICGWAVRQLNVSETPGQTTDHSALLKAEAELEKQRQRVAVLERSGQVADAASTDLQQTLHERQEEIAGLRADLAFYSRLTGGNGKREGLAIHSVHLKSVEGSPRAFNFAITLTQNLKKSQLITGHVRITAEGVRDGQLTTLAWLELGQGQEPTGIGFSFKYFQRLQGTIMLPEGFTPNRLKVRAEANGDSSGSEQDFAWNEALANEESNDVQ